MPQLLQKETSIGFTEFIILMALLTALMPLAIDIMLPALAEIGLDLGVVQANNNQLIISLLFLGFACGQLFYGSFSDSKGRKPAIYVGIVIFIIGSILSLCATNMLVMLCGRFLQGIGAAGPRITVMALVRDKYHGADMARVMSFIMTIFILAPMVAPAIGQAIVSLAHWRIIFAMLVVLAVVALLWFARRQPETLLLEKRIPFSWNKTRREIAEICTNRMAIGYTVISGLVFGPFIGHLNSVQQILQIHYDLGDDFPLYFAFLALSIGVASYMNAHMVKHYGMVLLSRLSLISMCVSSAIILSIMPLFDYNLALPIYITYLLIIFYCMGILLGNLNSLAMETLGHIAGIGSAVVGAISTFIAVFIGTLIGYAYNDTIYPLVIGFAAFSLLPLIITYWVKVKI